MQKLIFFIGTIFLLSFIGCKKMDKDAIPSEKVAVQDIKKVEVSIEGMTCEIGCAKLIESKLSKTEGVKFVAVNFEEERGIIEFDANMIDEKKISEVIEAAGGGDLYSVVTSKFLE
jgi:Cu+-exporting ATPase